MGISAKELTDELDLEFLFDRESIGYKLARGASGMQMNVRECPDCGDTRWRVYLNRDTGLGNCFVCGLGYNKLSFIKTYLNADWREVFTFCEAVLKEQGWRPKRVITAAVEDEAESTVKLPFSHPLPTPDGANLVYLEKRGLTGDIARYYHLRWCEFGWWDAKDESGKTWQQRFDGRVIIPVYDLDGSLKTFQGRDITSFADRKYLFPIGLPGTGRFLLNGQNVHATKEVAMGEGFFDVAAMKMAFDAEVGLRHVVSVGSFGKHLSYGNDAGDDQLGRFMRLKKLGVEQVTIMWDGEKNALTAALDAAKLLTGIGLRARIALLPAGKDPNEVLPEVVVKAYYEAQLWTPALDIKLRLRNPYR